MRTEYCSKCGSILEPGAAFCGECGAPVTSSKEEKEPASQQTSFWQSAAAPEADSTPTQQDAADHTAAAAASSQDFQPSQANTQPTGNYFQQPSADYGSSQTAQDGFQQAQNTPNDFSQNTQNGFQGGFQQPQGTQNGFSQGNFQQPQGGFRQAQGGFQQFHGNSPYSSQPGMSASNQKTIVLILGIVAIIFALIFPLITYPAAIVGLVLASKAKKAGENVQGGFICCIIGLILAVLNSLLGVVMALAQMAYYL